MKLLLLIFTVPLFVIFLNLYYRERTFRSVDDELKKLNWFNLSELDYIQKSYHFVADRFSRVNKCWLKFPWRNMFFTNIWKMKGFGLPCHVQNILFQRILRKRLKRKDIRTLTTWALKKSMLIHFYSQVKMGDKWVDVDVWGKKWGIPFGGNVHNSRLIDEN